MVIKRQDTSTSDQSVDRAELDRLRAENAELRRQVGEFQRADADRALRDPANGGPAETNHVDKSAK
ncbi:MAG TPA: hypothetical protein VIQ79_30525 [Kribbella sp.]